MKDPSVTSQVFEWLETLPIGTTIYAFQAQHALSHLKPVNVAASLSLLAQRQHGVLEKQPKVHGYKGYRITREILRGWKGYCAPRPREGYTRAPKDAPIQVDRSGEHEARGYARDKLLEAAALLDDGVPLDDETIKQLIRHGYFAVKDRRTPCESTSLTPIERRCEKPPTKGKNGSPV